MQPIFDLINEIVSTLDRFDANRCLANICANILDVTGAGACFIFINDQQESVFELTEARSETGTPTTVGAGQTRMMAEEVVNSRSWKLWREEGGGAEQPESVAGIPLRAFDEMIGALIMVRTSAPFSEEEIRTLVPLANIVALAVPREELEGFAKLAEICIRFLEEKDPYTHGHSLRVMKYALVLADAMGLTMAEKRELRLCALLHDIGKVIIKDSILSKKESLTRSEMAAIRMHPSIGSSITLKIHPGISDKILSHHEHWDGNGYPAGLKGEEIPRISRIIAVADALDAMTSRRPYRGPSTLAEAVEEIRKNEGTQFDPYLVAKLVEMFGQNRLDVVQG